MLLRKGHEKNNCVAIGLLVAMYLLSFTSSALLHPIEHLSHDHNTEESLEEVERCYHLHNALDFHDICKHQSHVSEEHKHCEFCDIISNKIEYTAKSKDPGLISTYLLKTKIYFDLWQKDISKDIHPLRGPPLV